MISVLLGMVASQSPGLQEPPAGIITSVSQHSTVLDIVLHQVRGAVAGTTMAGVAVLQNSPVVWARVTVTDLWTAGLTTGTRDVGET